MDRTTLADAWFLTCIAPLTLTGSVVWQENATNQRRTPPGRPTRADGSDRVRPLTFSPPRSSWVPGSPHPPKAVGKTAVSPFTFPADNYDVAWTGAPPN